MHEGHCAHARGTVVPFLKQRTTFSQLLLLYAIRRPPSTRLLDYYRSRLRSIAQIMILPIRCLRPIGLYKSIAYAGFGVTIIVPETDKALKNSFLYLCAFFFRFGQLDFRTRIFHRTEGPRDLISSDIFAFNANTR